MTLFFDLKRLLNQLVAPYFLTDDQLSQSLTIDGIPYWDVFAPELASRYIPSAFGKCGYSELINTID